METFDEKANNDSALKRYDILMQQNRFEHTSFWTRFGFMMVSQMGLLGFFLNMFLGSLKEPNRLYLLSSLPLCIVGLFLVKYFIELHKITKWWVDHWLSLIEGMEKNAFGDLYVVRGARKQSPGSLRIVAKRFVRLFAVIWCLAIVFIITLVAFQLVCPTH